MVGERGGGRHRKPVIPRDVFLEKEGLRGYFCLRFLSVYFVSFSLNDRTVHVASDY